MTQPYIQQKLFLRKLILFIFTIRYLKFKQIVYRIYYRVAKPYTRSRVFSKTPDYSIRNWKYEWISPLIVQRCYFPGEEFHFLGKKEHINTSSDWNNPQFSKLWLYNLHYMDDLLATDSENRVDSHHRLLQRWINENPPMEGNGWEPYTLSLRLVNIIKWLRRDCASQHISDTLLTKSLVIQAKALSVQIEWNIMANHLFTNGKALIFAGAFLKGKFANALIRTGLEILDTQVTEQFLEDGGHYELSPMYHSILIWDMCDLYNLSITTGLEELIKRQTLWRKTIEKGIVWLSRMVHPDGDVSFFNDSTTGICPNLQTIINYANLLGIKTLNRINPKNSLSYMKNTGFCSVELMPSGRLIANLSQIKPSYQPGHAHADTLSFELSLHTSRVIVNSGISTYESGTIRQLERGTAMHSTVTLDNLDSTEVWGGFRVARRAVTSKIQLNETISDCTIHACHDGYARLHGKPIHCRTWKYRKDRNIIEIQDTVTGKGHHLIKITFPLHPTVTVASLNDHTAILNFNRHCLNITVQGEATLSARTTTYHPKFGESVPNRTITLTAVTVLPFQVITKLTWDS